MSRRASLPGASELFRPTREPKQAQPVPKAAAAKSAEPAAKGVEAQPAASGRIRHDHKITVYFSEDELLALEDANLELRRSHGIRVDRGRIVRIAVAQVLADLEARGPDSTLVNELRSQ